MSHEYVCTISSRYLQKWLRYDIKHVKKKQTLFTSFRDLTVIFLILFFDRFWRFKKCFGVIFRVLCENLIYNVYRSSKFGFFWFDLFTWWPEMTLTCIMVSKHRKWFLQMSVTLSIPIHWLCLCLTSKFYSPSPKSRKFLLWSDLWPRLEFWPFSGPFRVQKIIFSFRKIFSQYSVSYRTRSLWHSEH